MNFKKFHKSKEKLISVFKKYFKKGWSRRLESNL